MPFDLVSRARALSQRIRAGAAALVDSWGRPFKEAALRRPTASPGASGSRPWKYDSVAAGLTPAKLAAMLTAADGGDTKDLLSLAFDLERRDSHAGAQLRTRKLALASLPWQVEAVSDAAPDKALAAELQAIVDDPEFTFLVIDLMDAVLKGYAVAEIEWARGDRWTPRRFIWRDQRHFVVDPNDGTTLRLRTDAQPKNGEDMPAFVFIQHVPRLASGPLATAGLVRPVAIMYLAKTLGVGAWLSFMELFGIPMRLGKYTKAMSEDDVDALEKALASMGLDGYGVMPDGALVEILEAHGRGNGTGEHERLAEWADRQVSKAILGQTMTADNGASLSQAKVHQLVRRDILLADALALAATLQRDLIRVYVDLNYGPPPTGMYPKLRCVTDEPEDRELFVKALVQLVDRGLQVEQSVVQDKMGLPAPAPGAAVLSPAGKGAAPAADPTPGDQPQPNARAARTAGPKVRRKRRAEKRQDEASIHRCSADAEDFIARESDPSAAAERPFVEAVRRAAKNASTFTDFLAQLRSEEADADVFVKELALRMLQARGMGDATDEVE